MSFSLSEENDECAASSSSVSGCAVGGGITKWELCGVGSGESSNEELRGRVGGRDEMLFRGLSVVVMAVVVGMKGRNYDCSKLENKSTKPKTRTKQRTRTGGMR